MGRHPLGAADNRPVKTLNLPNGLLQTTLIRSSVASATWPDRPAFPAESQEIPGNFSLLRIPGIPRCPSGRSAVRDILKTLLSEWADSSVQLEESQSGPVVRQKIRGRRCFLSITYAANTAWAGIALDAEVGVDAVEIRAFKEMRDLERIYLGTESDLGSCGSNKAPLEFAIRWSAMEARFKRARLPLTEAAIPPEAEVLHVHCEDVVVAIAFRQAADSAASATKVRTPKPVAPRARP